MHVDHRESTYRSLLPRKRPKPRSKSSQDGSTPSSSAGPAPSSSAESPSALSFERDGEVVQKASPGGNGSPAHVRTRDRSPVVELRKKRPEEPSREEQILVVDDEYWITDVIYEQLAIEGFGVDVTNTSGDVMDMLSSRPYDLVILDIYMPAPDGLTLLREIRQTHPFMAVLMLTAFSDAETAATAMRDGATDYIVKPYQSAELVSRIERALQHSQLLRERDQAQRLLREQVNEQTKKLRQQSKQLSQMLERVLVTYRATLKALEAALDVRDQSAPGHCRRVAKLAVKLATRMGFSGRDLVILEHGALLHDIGKMGIPDVILMKPGPLTDEEWETMRKHPEIGCDIVGHIDFLDDALPIIRHHHEHFDGSGYPDGLLEDEIPILARIFSVADSYDAQTNKRPYKEIHSVETAIRNLRMEAGSLYDPKIVAEFVEMIHEQEAEKARDRRPRPASSND